MGNARYAFGIALISLLAISVSYAAAALATANVSGVGVSVSASASASSSAHQNQSSMSSAYSGGENSSSSMGMNSSASSNFTANSTQVAIPTSLGSSISASAATNGRIDIVKVYSNLLGCVGGLFNCSSIHRIAQSSSTYIHGNQTLVVQDLKGNVAASSFGSTVVVGGQTNQSVQAAKVNSGNITASVDSRYRQQLSNSTIGQKTNISSATSISGNCGLYSCLVTTFLGGTYGFNYSATGIDNQSVFVISSSLWNSGYAMNATKKGWIANPNDIAQAIYSYKDAALGFAASATPAGLMPLNSTVSAYQQGDASAFVSWQASSAVSALNSSAAADAAAQYGAALPLGAQVQTSDFNEIHSVTGINGNSYVQRLVPSQVQVKQAGNTTIVGATNLLAGVQNYLNTSASGSAFDNISIVPSSNMTSYSVEVVNSGNSTSTAKVNPSYAVYSYAYVNSTIGDSNIVNVTYAFNVSKQWLQEKQLNPTWVVLLRFNTTTDSWQQLPTNETGQDISNYYFAAVSPGMSDYAIASTAPNAQSSVGQASSNGNGSGISSYYPYIGGVILVLIIAGVLMMRKGKGGGSPPSAYPQQQSAPASPPTQMPWQQTQPPQQSGPSQPAPSDQQK